MTERTETVTTEHPPIDPVDVLRAMRNDIGEWAADEIEALRALVAQAHRDSWSDEGEQMWACRGLVALSDEQVPVLLRALGNGSRGAGS